MRIKFIIAVTLCLGFILAASQTGNAQDNTYTVHVRKDFGYSMDSDIQGRFTIRLMGDIDKVSKVTFYIDDAVLRSLEEEPFSYQFQTEQFEAGMHRLFAEVLLNNGNQYRTSIVQYNFLSQKEASKQITTVLIGIGGAVVGTLLIVALIQGLVINRDGKPRHQSGTPRNYGLLGGTICQKCGRSFPRHIWGINLVVGRLDRCDHCGKWSMTIRATPKALRMAEEAEQESFDGGSLEVPVPVDNKDLLEETKYFDDI